MATNKTPNTSSNQSQSPLLGRYEIGKLLGHGTFAKVYHAKNVKTNESVAIKVIDKEKILKVGLMAHIKREISILRLSDQIRQDGLFHTFCGTPAYVAPEVLAKKGYDAAKVDIWSCGIVLFVLMAGYLPFQDQNIMLMYKKIYKGEFRCPRWFSSELVRLLSKLLDTNPVTRITIPEIMENRWFKKGFKHIKFYIEDDKVCSVQEEEDVDSSSDQSLSESESEIETRRRVTTLPRPASLNAFDIISFSPGFDLSGLFEEGGEGARKKDCRVSLEGSREGVKGPLTIAAEIFELTPKLVVVEVKKKGGDKGEYEDFCNRELKPRLQKLMQEESEAAPAAPVATSALAPSESPLFTIDPFPTDSSQLTTDAFPTNSTPLPVDPFLAGSSHFPIDPFPTGTSHFPADPFPSGSSHFPVDPFPTGSSHFPADPFPTDTSLLPSDSEY
ncbi:NON-SPECIFIC SERINE/THREONINE PROTEIN KINASE [Salix purpurea]|uniref:non-specific serine/threonine protein kinase n=1 Tax=Salix purpurea TaxID=77065 RepID=A0A9Q1AG92_SALPP|nr:NON-SPECIFIC SERINE/THREONINE PROTEIN KINASE [Salix purpurea]